ncbi:MAG: hypothetical protein HY236_04085 [Acidobacteria bacterium]|nr:hypothetical protein [Acidobacteriota bacterium]
MRVLRLLGMVVVVAGALQAGDDVLRGRLKQEPGRPPVIQAADQKTYTVSGDEFTKAQMADPRLNGREMEMGGRFAGPGQFEAASLFTIRDGKRYEVTYWCEICHIRAHKPGRCV